MAANVTYLFGAGASANALPVVRNLTERFEIFCNHFLEYLTILSPVSNIPEIEAKQKQLISNMKKHYTIDTYAKKLFLHNPILHQNEEYCFLIKYLSAYFIYEQLQIKIEDDCNRYLRDDSPYQSFEKNGESVFETNVKKIITNFDYRYDSFFASILRHNDKRELFIPENINFVSWNYDFQFEKAFMNFSNNNLDDAMIRLNVIGTPHVTFERPYEKSHLIKLNGTAGFAEGNKFNTLFDFSEHGLNTDSFEILKGILTANRSKYKNGLRFSWENSSLSTQSIDLARQKIQDSEIIVIIGYSFPYFNREIDKIIFQGHESRTENYYKFYIQAPEQDANSILKRFKGIRPLAKVELFTELDQFLIPSEMSL